MFFVVLLPGGTVVEPRVARRLWASAAGHKEKTLEFGKDLWMKYQLPTGHWIYFCAQIKKDKLDSNNASGQKNISNVLTQARMALTYPLFDPEVNRKVLLDHM